MYSIIPLQAVPNQTFSSKIPVDKQNITLSFTLNYNELANYWVVSITDSNGTMLITSLPIIPAQNILEQFKYMNIGSAYVVPRQTISEEWPTENTLDSDWYLVWSDTDG
ncbi:phage baseplate plug family protein [Pectinatus haikarae]|uniref:Cyanophage baseplate Pam3 plug gp18 domain-containing protein n=2 Tax=Pectinatus haikarae TaxID=349096 RepID=A0ABT9Y3S5_9FIRM|nr:hypothetical protein [Pectinatus haikarae]MDQ0202472.1 hypothetical protein [Pectinatus haikarae]